ncbi:hypothetical protein OE88DRAFT_1662532 [Heliocybe sulcata]|uniref:F-box domain-containing protein n=1 Tax=Heliocybe sulcata TaxID=5364 RepID=A0A5C3N050_9AGAM|nr:hypothetical protein OE88DRAFT_1662532 [Heliocybe sulcata]
MALISKLSKELLLEIFKYYISTSETEPIRYSTPYRWTKLRLVCSYWKEILESPMLWNQVSVTSLRAMKFVLDHKPVVDLDMRGSLVDLAKPADQQKLVRMQRLAGGVRSINLCTSKAVLKAWNAPTPRLKSLALRRMPGTPTTQAQVSDPSTLLTRFRSPMLTKLELQGFTWNEVKPMLDDSIEDLALDLILGMRVDEFASAIKTMTHLRRLRTSYHSLTFLRALPLNTMEELMLVGLGQVLDGDGLLAIVGQMQSLRRLEISTKVTKPSLDAAIIELPSLESITCLVRHHQEVEYLTRMKVPTLRHFRISAGNNQSENDTGLQEILQLVLPLVHQVAKNIHLRTAQFSSPIPDLHLAFTDEPAADPDNGIQLNLCVNSHEEFLCFIANYFAPVLARVESAYIGDGRYYHRRSLPAWRSIFRQMGNVQSLHLEQRGAKAMPGGLHYYPKRGICKEVFPKLRNLYLDNVRFRPQRRKKNDNWGIKVAATKRSFLGDLERSFQLRDAAIESNNLRNGNNIESKDGAEFEEAVEGFEDRTRRKYWTKPKDDGKFRLVIRNAIRLHTRDVEKLTKPGRIVIWDSVSRRN